MKGFGFAEHGGLERVGFVEIADPVPGPGEVRVRLKAAAFNRLDLFTLQGIPGVPIERPHVLGSDGAGIVDSVGPGVDASIVGDRVVINPGLWDGSCPACRRGHEEACPQYRIVGEHTQGTATRWVTVPRRNLHALPDDRSFEEGAAAPLVFQTAWRALATVGEVGPDCRVAIVGAGGGVVPAAVQVARHLGATVTVAARSRAKADRLRPFGATETVEFSEEHPLDRELWAASGKRGYDVIFDSVGAPTLPRSVRALARGGRVVVIGATAGPMVSLDLRILFWRQASVRGSTMASASEFEAMYDAWRRGALRSVIDSRWSWAEAPAALARFHSPELLGKIVLTLPE
ncbi:MAG: zinc-binding dehydrogenase [Thermoplasmata archaeon]